MKAIVGAAAAGAISFAMFVGLFALVGRFPVELDRAFVLAVTTPLLLIGSLIAGYVSGLVSRSAIAIVGTVAAVGAALAVATVLSKPIDGVAAPGTFVFVAAMAIIPAALGHLIAVAFRPGVIRA